MEDNFWNDSNVAEFAYWYKNLDIPVFDPMAEFKKSKESKPIQDFEVITYTLWDGKETIQSVRRLSDNEVFSIGDEIEAREGEYCNWENIYTIISMSIKTGILAFEIMNIKETNPTGSIWREIENIRKHSGILFTTEDGFSVYGSQPLWIVFKTFEKKYGIVSPKPTVLEYLYKPENNKYFYKEDAAKEYILQNKPIQVSYKELINFLDEQERIIPVPSLRVRLEKFFKTKIQTT